MEFSGPKYHLHWFVLAKSSTRIVYYHVDCNSYARNYMFNNFDRDG